MYSLFEQLYWGVSRRQRKTAKKNLFTFCKVTNDIMLLKGTCMTRNLFIDFAVEHKDISLHHRNAYNTKGILPKLQVND